MADGELARIRAEIERLQQQAQQLESDGRALDAAELAASRDYARSCRDHSTDEVVAGCARALRLYGFCVIDHVLPEADVPRVRQEIVEATDLIPQNARAHRDGDETAVRRPTRFGLPGNEACHQILFLPQLAEFLGHDAVTGVAREALDEHIRIAQFNTRPIKADNPDDSFDWNRRSRPGFGTAGAAAIEEKQQEEAVDKTTWREWHTDWPHMVHGGSRADAPAHSHMGSIRKREHQPFPDVSSATAFSFSHETLETSLIPKNRLGTNERKIHQNTHRFLRRWRCVLAASGTSRRSIRPQAAHGLCPALIDQIGTHLAQQTASHAPPQYPGSFR
jgi:hypothetical protein